MVHCAGCQPCASTIRQTGSTRMGMLKPTPARKNTEKKRNMQPPPMLDDLAREAREPPLLPTVRRRYRDYGLYPRRAAEACYRLPTKRPRNGLANPNAPSRSRTSAVEKMLSPATPSTASLTAHSRVG